MNSVAQDVLIHLNEEAVHTDAFTESVPGLEEALAELKKEFSANFLDQQILSEANHKIASRVTNRFKSYDQTVWVSCSLFSSLSNL